MRTPILLLLAMMTSAAYAQAPAPEAAKPEQGMQGMHRMAAMMHGGPVVCYYDGRTYSAGALLHAPGVGPVLECAVPDGGAPDAHVHAGDGAAAHEHGAAPPRWRVYRARPAGQN